MDKLIVVDPARRLGTLKSGPAGVKEHPWLIDVNWKVRRRCSPVQPPAAPSPRQPRAAPVTTAAPCSPWPSLRGSTTHLSPRGARGSR